jgi:hypothetical protein
MLTIVRVCPEVSEAVPTKSSNKTPPGMANRWRFTIIIIIISPTQPNEAGRKGQLSYP